MCHLISVLTTFYKLEIYKTVMWYNIEGAVKMSKCRLRRVRPGSSCADILKNIRNIRNKIRSKVKY